MEETLWSIPSASYCTAAITIRSSGPKEIWKEDLRLFDLAGINSATVNVFSWAKLQPSEEEYCFGELDEIIDTLSKANIQIVLATATAAMPAWHVHKYPEVARWLQKDGGTSSAAGIISAPTVGCSGITPGS